MAVGVSVLSLLVLIWPFAPQFWQVLDAKFAAGIDTSTVQFQAVMAVVAAVLGALFQNYVLPGRREGTMRATTIVTSKKRVHIGNTTLQVSNDNRTYITFATARAMAHYNGIDTEEQHERQAEADHRRRLREIDRAAKKTKEESESDDTAVMFFWLFLALAAIAVVVLFYVRYRQIVVTTVTLLVTATLCFTISCLITAVVRKVRLDRKLTVQVVVNTAVTLATLWLLTLLTNPPFVDDKAGFDRLLKSAGTLTFNEVLTGLFSSEKQAAVFAIAYQIIGLLFLLASSSLVLWNSLGVLVITGVTTRVRIDPNYVPGRLRRRIMTAGSGHLWIGSLILTIVSAVLITGLAAKLVTTPWPG